MSGPQHVVQMLRQCRDLQRYLGQWHAAYASEAASADEEWEAVSEHFRSCGADQYLKDNQECDECYCTIFSAASCDRHSTCQAGVHLFAQSTEGRGASFSHCCYCRYDLIICKCAGRAVKTLQMTVGPNGSDVPRF